VTTAGQRAKDVHAGRLVCRLSVDSSVQHDRRIGGEHRTIRGIAERRDHRPGLVTRESLHVGIGSLARKRVFVEIGGVGAVAYADLAEEKAAARRRRRQDNGVVTH
jgi:hypothetical protein